MPIYKDEIAKQLEDKQEEFEERDDRDLLEKFRESLVELIELESLQSVKEKLREIEYPGALPAKEVEDTESVNMVFEQSKKWESHEATNRWASDVLEEKSSIAADGSQIEPVSEFSRPVALVQAVWMENRHSKSKDYSESYETEVLTPEDLEYEGPEGRIRVDNQEVGVRRFELECRVLKQRIERASEKNNDAVVFFDGSLIPSFTKVYDGKKQERFLKALAGLLAASQHHRVPVVGYVSGSRATELTEMLQNIDDSLPESKIRDHRILDELLEGWGDRIPAFAARRGEIQDRLQTTYRGENYSFGDEILFTYMKTGAGDQIDRLEFPSWILEDERLEETLSIVRAEAGVGRGYPEILQAVDTDAVISRKDREEFLQMYQKFMEQKGLQMDWNNKALSKERRRR